MITGDEKFVRGKFRCAVKIHRATGLVRGEGHDLGDAFIDAGINQVHRSQNVGLDSLKRVVFGGRDNLRCCGMNDVIYAVNRPIQAVTVSNIANEETHTLVTLKELRHLPLLHFIAGIDNEALGIELLQRHRNKSVAKGPCPAGHQNGGL